MPETTKSPGRRTVASSVARSAATAGGAKVLGVEVSQEVAERATSSPRRVGEGTRIDGIFRVTEIASEGDGLFSMQLESDGADRPVTADARSIFLPDEQIELLFRSLRNGQPVRLSVNAWKRRGRVVEAEVVRVDAISLPPPPAQQ